MASSRTPQSLELPLLALQKEVLLPQCQVRITVSSPIRIVAMDRYALARTPPFVAVFSLQDTPDSSSTNAWNVKEGSIYHVGCLARITHVSRAHTNATFQYALTLRGVARCEIQELSFKSTVAFAMVHIVRSVEATREQVNELQPQVHKQLQALSENNPGTFISGEIRDVISAASLDVMCDVISGYFLRIKAVKQEMLETIDVYDRAVKLLRFLQELSESTQVIPSEEPRNQHLGQREMLVKPRLERVAKPPPPPNDNDSGDDMQELEKQLANAQLPEQVRRIADREMKRLQRLQPVHPEWSVIRSYLECLLDLPWEQSTPDNIDIAQARRSLDDDHFGLDRVKRRIMEFLAVVTLRKTTAGSILCLVGPPGVGKTSLGKSIAAAMGRKFHRVSLGGVHDEAEIRGHRRTYIGALPGNIIHAMRRVGVSNPVILLDEVDKLGHSFKGDPAAALLEVLDPEQNNSFTDHYLNVPFDLSRVFFICTANQVGDIPAPLLDRMELVEIPGYTYEEKVAIADRYLVAKQIERSGLTAEHIQFPRQMLLTLTTQYTREAGVRQLERVIGSICRHVAVEVTTQRSARLPIEVSSSLIEEVLGPAKFRNEAAQRVTVPGVATGMAVTPVGGELLFIECSSLSGRGDIIITGHLGEVMQESTRIALSWVRGRAATANAEEPEHVGEDTEQHHDRFHSLSLDAALRATGVYDRIFHSTIHVHVPAGAIPKDGPSAGVAIVASLISLFTNRCVNPAVSMTGEVTLRGLVLPVGGIKDKVLAAHRGGIKHVILPERNRKDMVELPEDVVRELQFSYVEHVEQLLDIVLLPKNQREHLSNVANAAQSPSDNLRSFL